MTETTASARLIDSVIQVARHNQQDVDALLASVGIEHQELNRADVRFPARSFNELLDELARRTGNPRIALRIGETTQPRMLGSIGFLMSTAESLAQAYRCVIDYLPLLIEGIHLSVDESPERVALTLDLEDDEQIALVEWLMACLCNWPRWLTGRQALPIRVDFAFAAPADSRYYQQFFAAEICFSAGRNRLLLPIDAMGESCLDANEEMYRLHQAFADQLLSASGRDGALVAQIKSILRNRLSAGQSKLDRVALAQSLNLSLRTLQRKLDQQGTNYQTLFDQTRKEMTQQLIQRGDLSFGEISHQLGFANLSAFQKAFKRWTGKAPSEFRAQHRPTTLQSRRTSPRVLSELIYPDGLSEAQLYPLAQQLIHHIEAWRQRGLPLGSLSPRHIGISHDTATQLQLSLVDPSPQSHSPLQERLAYQAPEHSGLLPFPVGSYSDTYALGCLLYAIVHGQPPHNTSNLRRLFGAQINEAPSLRAGLSSPLIQVLNKLLALPATERYQSLTAVNEDLAQCLQALSANDSLETFSPGRSEVLPLQSQDIGLAGREPEQARLETLLRECERGETRSILLQGNRGSGKTALIDQLRLPLYRSRGIMVSGVFLPQTDPQPYAVLIGMMQQLLRQLIVLPETHHSIWRQRIKRELGNHGQVLLQRIPELAELFDHDHKHAHYDSLPPINGSHSPAVLESTVFGLLRACRERLLVLSVDNLQWADAPSLALLARIHKEFSGHPLMLISARRSSENESSAIKANPNRQDFAAAETINLQPLDSEQIYTLLQQRINASQAELTTLTYWLKRHSDGSPGAVLGQLQSRGWLYFSPQQQRWSIHQQALTSVFEQSSDTDTTLVKLYAPVLESLTPPDLELLQWAAVIGPRFDTELLAKSRQDPVARIAIRLWPAQQARLITPTEDSADGSAGYQFCHSALQIYVYESIPLDRRQSIHLAVGKVLKDSWNSRHDIATLFACTDHLNRADNGQHRSEHYWQLMALNRLAGGYAQEQANLQSARYYLQHSLALMQQHTLSDRPVLPADRGLTDNGQAFDILLQCAQLDSLLDDEPAASSRFEQLIAHFDNAVSPQDAQNNAPWLRLQQARIEHELRFSRLDQARTILISSLIQLGIRLELAETRQRVSIQRFCVEDLFNAADDAPTQASDTDKLSPDNTDTAVRATGAENVSPVHLATPLCRADPRTALLQRLILIAELQGDAHFDIYLLSKIPDLKTSPDSYCAASRAYLCHWLQGQYPQARQQVLLAKRSLDAADAGQQALCLLRLGLHVLPWIDSLAAALDSLNRALTIARLQDDLCISTLAQNAICHFAWLQGTPLTSLAEQLHEQQQRSNRRGSQLSGPSLADSVGYLLRQITDADDEPTTSDATEQWATRSSGSKAQGSANTHGNWRLLAHCTVAVLLDERTRWPGLLQAADHHHAAAPGQFAQVELALLTLLMRAELARNAGPESRARLLRQCDFDLCRLEMFSRYDTPDTQARFHLAAAELAALNADTECAMDHFEQALADAEKQANGYLQALACERYGLFWQRRNRHSLARQFLLKAAERYLQWGATRKASQLSTGFPSDRR